MKRLLLQCLIYVALVVTPAAAKPLPFLQEAELGEFSSPAEVYLALSTIPDNAVSKKAFLEEIKKNLNMTAEVFAQQIQDPDAVRVVEWKKGFPPLLTAGLKDGKAVYWRSVNEGEMVATIKVGIDWKPAFLLRCANPVKHLPAGNTGERTQTSSASVDTPAKKVFVQKTGCWSTEQPRVTSNSSTYGYIEEDGPVATHTDVKYTYVFPTACITVEDWKKIKPDTRKKEEAK